MSDALDGIKNRCIRAILEVNDLCPDGRQKGAMRAITMTAVNTAFHEVRNAFDNQQAGVPTGRRTDSPQS